MALLLHYRKWGLAFHTNEVVQDPAMKALYPKVHFFVDEELDKSIDRDYTDYHAIVTVTMKDGKVYKIHSNPPRLNFEQIKEKFYDCTSGSGIITKEHSDKIIDIVSNLENHDQADLMVVIA